MSEKAVTGGVPVNLDAFAFTHCKIEALAEFNPAADNEVLPPDHSIELANDPTSHSRIQFKLRTIYNAARNPAGPYVVDAECIVHLSFLQMPPTEEDRLKVALALGHGVAIGAMREHIAAATSRHVNGALFLGISTLNLQQSSDKPSQGEPMAAPVEILPNGERVKPGAGKASRARRKT